MIKQMGQRLGFFWISVCISIPAFTQGDLAVYDTFTRYAPAVFSVEVEIPEVHIMERYELQIEKLRDFHDSLLDALTGQSSENFTFHQFETWIANLERRMELLKEQLLVNNRIKGTAFAVDDHHLVTISSLVKNATLGGAITISNHLISQIPAKLLNVDSQTGIAVLRVVNATFAEKVQLDNHRNMLPEASYIMSIQRPYDLPASPISGMIGGYYRRLELFPIERYIQTDIPLYPGNEGAPVFSPSGQLVGMIASNFPQGQSPSISFVIPADLVSVSAKDIIEKGQVERGEIPGIQFIGQGNRVYVQNVSPNSPYDDVLLPGDVVEGVDGGNINSMMTIFEALHNVRPNQQLNLIIRRENSRVQVSVESKRIQ